MSFINNEIKLLAPEEHQLLKVHLNNLKTDIDAALGQYEYLQHLRERAKNIRHYSIENMAYLLTQFEENAKKNKSVVYWAQDGDEAIQHILKIVKRSEAKSIFKARASELDEIEVPQIFKSKKIPFNYIQLGEYLSNLYREQKSHPTFPLAGISEGRITHLIKRSLQIKEDLELDELIQRASDAMRVYPDFPSVSITGADFLIADSGALAWSEDEGSSYWASSATNIQIVVAGIDRVIPKLEQLPELLHLNAGFHYGNSINPFTNIVSGPADKYESDGPTQLYIILLDNGRSDVLQTAAWREILYDMDGISFLNDCQTYQNLSKNNFPAQLLGPVGMAMGPLFYSEEDYGHLPFFYTNHIKQYSNPYLINLERMLLKTRAWVLKENDNLLQNQPCFLEALQAVLKRDKMNALKKNSKFRKSFIKVTGLDKNLPFVKKTFNEWWKSKQR